jgi:ferritin-like metal-binding protein YciE
MASNDMLIAWLNDAHAMEKGIVEALEAQVKVAEDHPEVQSGIQRHLDATKNHVQLVEQCLDELGEKPSAVKSGVAMVTAKAQGLLMGGAKDNLVKSALNDYAAEHMEIASYKALRISAEQLGHPFIVGVCDQILQDEEAMASWLDQQMPALVREAVQTGSN